MSNKNMHHPGNEFSLYVGDLPLNCRDDELRDLFQQKFKSVKRVLIIRNEDGSSRGFGFIRFDARNDFEAALSQKMKIGEHTLRLDEAHSRDNRFNKNRSRFNSFNSTGNNNSNHHNHHFNSNNNNHHHNQHHHHQSQQHGPGNQNQHNPVNKSSQEPGADLVGGNVGKAVAGPQQQQQQQPLGGTGSGSSSNSSNNNLHHPNVVGSSSGSGHQQQHSVHHQHHQQQLPPHHSAHLANHYSQTSRLHPQQNSVNQHQQVDAGKNLKPSASPVVSQLGNDGPSQLQHLIHPSVPTHQQQQPSNLQNTQQANNNNTSISSNSSCTSATTTTNTTTTTTASSVAAPVSLTSDLPAATANTGALTIPIGDIINANHPSATLSVHNLSSASHQAIGPDLRGYNAAAAAAAAAAMMDATHLSTSDQPSMMPPTSVYSHLYPYGPPPPFGYMPPPPQPNPVIPISAVPPAPPNQSSPSSGVNHHHHQHQHPHQQHTHGHSISSSSRYNSGGQHQHHQQHNHHHQPQHHHQQQSHTGNAADPTALNAMQQGGVQPAPHQGPPFYYYYPSPLYFDQSGGAAGPPSIYHTQPFHPQFFAMPNPAYMPNAHHTFNQHQPQPPSASQSEATVINNNTNNQQQPHQQQVNMRMRDSDTTIE